MRGRGFGWILILLLAAGVAVAQSGGLPAGLDEIEAVPGLTLPTALAFAPDGRLFVCEQRGTVRVVRDGGLLSTPFATLAVSSDGERGLLGIALDPQFTQNSYVYVYYTTAAQSLSAPPTPKNRVSRLTASGDAMVAGSEQILLDGIPSDSGSHNAGCVRFGADGKLYVSTGDGGLNRNNSQDLGSLAGKLLRLNPDGGVPADNPFSGQVGCRGEIYCYGLRNPFRFCFRPGTNVPYIADVGGSAWEEVNIGQPGANFGWPISEGPNHAAGVTLPAYAYEHAGVDASITGGCFVQSSTWPPAYQGEYVFGDFVRNSLGRLTFSANHTLSAAATLGPSTRSVDFAQGPDGDIYYACLFPGSIRRIRFVAGRFALASVPGTIAQESPMQVRWHAPAGRNNRDWVGLFRVSTPNTAYQWWSYTDGGTSGTFALTAPATPGTYEFRYLLNNGFADAVRSLPITITGYELVPTANRVQPGGALGVSYAAPAGRPALDWIGLFKVGDPNSAYGWWSYTGGAASGSFALTAPAAPGSYEFRYLPNNGFADVRRSAPVVVDGYVVSASTTRVAPGGALTVNWAAPAGRPARDWVGLFRVGDPNTDYGWWAYTNGAVSGSSALTAPSAPGNYEFRYLLNDGFADVARSAAVAVEN